MYCQEPKFRCRNGLIATAQGRSNRFGFKPYFITEKRRVKDASGEWRWMDVDVTIYIDSNGRCVIGGDSDYDHKSVQHLESVEREELGKRRSKDNWL